MTAAKRPTRAVCLAALRNLERALHVNPGSPHVSIYITRRQAEAVAALLEERAS